MTTTTKSISMKLSSRVAPLHRSPPSHLRSLDFHRQWEEQWQAQPPVSLNPNVLSLTPASIPLQGGNMLSQSQDHKA